MTIARRMLPVVLLMVAVVSALAERNPDKTFETWNGRYWHQLSVTDKIFYVTGYVDGVSAALSNSSISDKEWHLLMANSLPKSTVAETVDFLTPFFETPENRSLPITWGIQIFAMKVRGDSDAKIDKMILDMRSKAAKATD